MEEVKEVKLNIKGVDKDNYIKVKAFLMSNLAQLDSNLNEMKKYEEEYSKNYNFWKKLKDLSKKTPELFARDKNIQDNFEKTDKAYNDFLRDYGKAEEHYKRYKETFNTLFTEKIVDGVAQVTEEEKIFCKYYSTLID